MKILIIHATKLTERAANMRQQLDPLNMDYEFIREYDKEELTEDILDEHFVKGTVMHEANGAASCAMKHILACRYVVERGMDGALILEDDIQLHRDFKPRFEQSIRELRERYAGRPVLVSYEDSTLTFVPRSQRKKGQMLYPAKSGRYTGAFFLSVGGGESHLGQYCKREMPFADRRLPYIPHKEGCNRMPMESSRHSHAGQLHGTLHLGDKATSSRIHQTTLVLQAVLQTIVVLSEINLLSLKQLWRIRYLL